MVNQHYIRELEKLIVESVALHTSEDTFSEWRNTASQVIKSFDPEVAKKFDRISFSPLMGGYDDYEREVAFRAGLTRAMGIIRATLRVHGGQKLVPSSPTLAHGQSKDVFIVHGHDTGMRDAVELYIEKLGLRPIILKDETDKGCTIIEKLDRYRNVGYAIALLSPDDLGGKSGGVLQPRPRQNVILEIGYFLGAIGRDRTFLLLNKDLERPSDLLGVVYTEFDDNKNWQRKIRSELLEVGLVEESR